MKSERQPAPSAGFTMMEVVSVLAVVALVATVSLPRMSGAVAQSRVDRAAAVMASDLEMALAVAARQGTPVRIVFDPQELTYSFTDRSSGTLLHVRRMGPDSELPVADVSFSETVLDVFPKRVVAAPLTVTLTAGEASARVEMMPAGLIRVEKP